MELDSDRDRDERERIDSLRPEEDGPAAEPAVEPAATVMGPDPPACSARFLVDISAPAPAPPASLLPAVATAANAGWVRRVAAAPAEEGGGIGGAVSGGCCCGAPGGDDRAEGGAVPSPPPWPFLRPRPPGPSPKALQEKGADCRDDSAGVLEEEPAAEEAAAARVELVEKVNIRRLPASSNFSLPLPLPLPLSLPLPLPFPPLPALPPTPPQVVGKLLALLRLLVELPLPSSLLAAADWAKWSARGGGRRGRRPRGLGPFVNRASSRL